MKKTIKQTNRGVNLGILWLGPDRKYWWGCGGTLIAAAVFAIMPCEFVCKRKGKWVGGALQNRIFICATIAVVLQGVSVLSGFRRRQEQLISYTVSIKEYSGSAPPPFPVAM